MGTRMAKALALVLVALYLTASSRGLVPSICRTLVSAEAATEAAAETPRPSVHVTVSTLHRCCWPSRTPQEGDAPAVPSGSTGCGLCELVSAPCTPATYALPPEPPRQPAESTAKAPECLAFDDPLDRDNPDRAPPAFV